MLPLLVLGGMYILGWRRMRRIRQPFPKPSQFTRWHLASYLIGLGLLGVALISPIDVLGQQLFALHMVQHLILMMIVPPLLLLANPYPILLWSLPKPWRRRILVPLMARGETLSSLHTNSYGTHLGGSLNAWRAIWLAHSSGL